MKKLLLPIVVLIAILGCATAPETEQQTIDESPRDDSESVAADAEPENSSEDAVDDSVVCAEAGDSEAPAEEVPSFGAAPRSDGAGGARASESASEPAIEFLTDEEDESAGEPALPSATGPSGLRAGFADDNKQFNYFVEFLDEYRHVSHFELDVRERIILTVVDQDGQPVANADVDIAEAGSRVATLRTVADGTIRIFANALGIRGDSISASVNATSGSGSLQIDRDGPRNVELEINQPRVVPDPVDLDIVFVMDTTGSMGEEIERLRRTIELIYLNLAGVDPRVSVRFGMVLYKDRGDEYVTQIVPLTEDLPAFQAELETVTADGGGDVPEDLQAALHDTVNDIEWTVDGVRLAFIVTDAPPQLYEEPGYAYTDTSRAAAELGLKIHSVGTGGLGLQAEYILRQISQYTGGRYIFLTFGESGESEGGRPGSVSHHTGANYQTDRLETIIIRFAREELAQFLDIAVEPPDEYFQAVNVDFEEREVTLRKLFQEAVGQLLDFSSIRIPADATVGALPIVPSEEGSEPLTRNAEYFSAQLLFAAAQSNRFELVERADLEQLLEEIELQLTGLVDRDTQVRVGELLGAEFLIFGQLYHRDPGEDNAEYEIFLRLVRTETGEVLSVTKALAAEALGL